MVIYRTRMQDRLDQICFDYYGTTSSRQVERVLDFNPGLATFPAILPPGIIIRLPERDESNDRSRVTRQINIWE